MVAPQACVAVEISGPPAAQDQRAALERRCSDILGARRCRLVAPGEGEANGCWQVVVTTEGGDTPTDASVVLSDASEPQHAPVRRDVTFRPNDAVAERWATLGLVIAALVTVEEHSAAEAPSTPALGEAGGGFAPPEARAEAPRPAAVAVAAGASAVGAVGHLPEAALGARVELALAHAWFSALARATLFPASSRAGLGPMGEAVELSLAAFGVGVCGGGGAGRLRARGCVGGDVARTEARGAGVSETNAAVAWWGSTWAAASLAYRLHARLALTAGLEGALTYLRPTFAIHGVTSEFTSAPVAAALTLGVEVSF